MTCARKARQEQGVGGRDVHTMPKELRVMPKNIGSVVQKLANVVIFKQPKSVATKWLQEKTKWNPVVHAIQQEHIYTSVLQATNMGRAIGTPPKHHP